MLGACRCWPVLYPATLQIKLQSPLDQRQEHLKIPAVVCQEARSQHSQLVQLIDPRCPGHSASCWCWHCECFLLTSPIKAILIAQWYSPPTEREPAVYILLDPVSMETYCSSFLGEEDCPPYGALNTPSLQPPQGLCTSCFFCSIALSPGIHMAESFRSSTNFHVITVFP